MTVPQPPSWWFAVLLDFPPLFLSFPQGAWSGSESFFFSNFCVETSLAERRFCTFPTFFPLLQGSLPCRFFCASLGRFSAPWFLSSSFTFFSFPSFLYGVLNHVPIPNRRRTFSDFLVFFSQTPFPLWRGARSIYFPTFLFSEIPGLRLITHPPYPRGVFSRPIFSL